MKNISKVAYKYLRHNKKFPHIMCPGCSHGIVMGSLIRAMDALDLNKNNVVMISGIGCSGRIPAYIDVNTLHTLHGRALAFATGVKLAKPELKVIVVTGDGDCTAIGGNHFIHACRRNIDITTIVLNNSIYGMTGGQYSPTTPFGSFASTAKYGNVERPFDICSLAEGAGAAFVGRTTGYHYPLMDKLITKAISKKGFAMVEVMSACYTAYGRKNKLKSPVDMFKAMKDNSVMVARANQLSPEELVGKLVIGEFVDRDQPAYTDEYQKIVDIAGSKGEL